MGTHRLKVPLAIFCLCFFWIAGFASLSPRELLGIAPQDVGYYKSDVIKCKDGSKKFTKQQLNDEFCDCPDGTDEPGTSACPEGKFYCRNAGHIPQTIFSSRVNDGVCDCCDGSDEYNGSANCPNTCWEAGKAAREKIKKKIATHQEGLLMRKQEVEKAKQAFAKDEAELLKLKNEEKILKGLVEKLREHKERIEKAEEEERLRKEKEEKKRRDAEIKSNELNKSSEESPQDDTEGTQDTLEKASQGKIEVVQESAVQLENEYKSGTEIPDDHTVTQITNDHGDSITSSHVSDHKSDEVPSDYATDQAQSSETTEGLSKEELGRLVASRWTGEQTEQGEEQTKESDDAKEEEQEHNIDFPESAEEENYDSYNSENDDDRHKYDDDDFEDETDEEYQEDHVEPDVSTHSGEDFKSDFPDATPSGRPSWLDKIQQTVQNIIQAFNFFKTPVDISESSRVKNEYDDASSKLSKLQSRISTLSEKLKHDFGKEKEFYSFYDHCFENKKNKYTYKVCPFKKATQVEGHSTTQLGRWEKFDESYRAMQFANGDRCWNGPDRSLKVRLRCGLKDELADVDEPSRCEYVAILSTPILCLEEKLKELQEKLEDMNKSQPSHDEL
ncbi:glucosidase 2 subunit beta-like isoform X2 [Canna indica]|uniref:Glucosidase 2 subunit beta n=1 Tax=Canna indica TaxID=4628 RepID=A0AAQ3KWI2_9LILI|nr:glucosidase 2 subunit beta-like isoform X2 [Canna indica]